MSDAKKEDARIRARLASLDAERAALEERLAALECRRETPIRVDRPSAQLSNPASITTSSSTTEKVALFRRLFAGRTDIFPSGGKIEKRVDPATPRPAPMNGSREYAASPK
jgi:hypothetical protein